VYPELVIRDEKGRIDGVRYDELAPMLLNEMQKQAQKIDAQAKTNADQAAEIRDLKAQTVAQADQLKSTQQQVAELNDLRQELRSALLKLQPKDQLVAQR
jgi:F0F1-type ATP synthase membrane subunit b/b'